VGIEVLYEGIETREQLDICIDAKGRYFQGFLLAEPQPSILNATVNHDVFSTSSDRSITALHDRSDRVNARRRFWDLRVERFFSEKEFSLSRNDLNEFFSELFLALSGQIKRIYLCNRRGEQLSYNIEMDSDGLKWNDYRHRNWAWRGYFQEATIMFDAGMKSHLTTTYRDATTKEKMYTYVYSINADLFLFIDIPQPDGEPVPSVGGMAALP
jgi:hypothetical protein